jgi:hypothetical protein
VRRTVDCTDALSRTACTLHDHKWRRQVSVTTSSCASTSLDAPGTAAASLKGRLPRNKGEGDLPQIALATGGADPLECLLLKIGIDEAEFTNPGVGGRINLFTGAGGTTSPATWSYDPTSVSPSAGQNFPDSQTLWSSDVSTPSSGTYDLAAYDVTLLGCEGGLTNGNKSNAALQAMQTYADGGGRVFAEHYHYAWMYYAALLSGSYSTGTYTMPYAKWSSMVTWNTNLITLANGTMDQVLTTFPKASLMAQWMAGTWLGAPGNPFGVNGGRNSIKSINDTSDVLLWIRTVSGALPQYFSFDTPVGASPACGRFVFSDIHVSSGDLTGTPFPTGCDVTVPMSAQELALEYMFFDIASPVCGGSVTPPTCTPSTCAAQGASCGSAPDGCGGTLSCGTCPTGSYCSAGKCATSSCVPTTCGALGYNCGTWSDGCGGVLNCGACSAPATCGGAGKPGVCGGASCTPTTCAAQGLKCGSASDGCGGALSCGTCPTGSYCSAGACVTSSCMTATCSSLGLSCGAASDGCGGTLSCGTCPTGSYCSGGKCATSSCMPTTCGALGYDCGTWADGCGGTLSCGTCASPATCGGGGKVGVCGGTGCMPTTCAALGYNCGQWADGCGGVLSCGTCAAPATCAGGGLPGVCGGTPCKPTTCAALGCNCGSAADGCGGLLTCGSCTTPDTCGGGGTANVCGHIQ